MKKTAFLMLMLTACGSRPVQSHSVMFIDQDLNDYVQSFYLDATNRGVHPPFVLGVQFGDVSAFNDPSKPAQITAGICVNYGYRQDLNYVTISKPIWDKLTLCKKILLVYHELAHCTMNYGHTTEQQQIMSDSIPTDANCKTVMQESNLDSFFNWGGK